MPLLERGELEVAPVDAVSPGGSLDTLAELLKWSRSGWLDSEGARLLEDICPGP